MILCVHHHAFAAPRERRSTTKGRKARFYGSHQRGREGYYSHSGVFPWGNLGVWLLVSTSSVMTPNWFHRTLSRTQGLGCALTPLDYLR